MRWGSSRHKKNIPPSRAVNLVLIATHDQDFGEEDMALLNKGSKE